MLEGSGSIHKRNERAKLIRQTSGGKSSAFCSDVAVTIFILCVLCTTQKHAFGHQFQCLSSSPAAPTVDDAVGPSEQGRWYVAVIGEQG